MGCPSDTLAPPPAITAEAVDVSVGFQFGEADDVPVLLSSATNGFRMRILSFYAAVSLSEGARRSI
jgi:hypothetical protein